MTLSSETRKWVEILHCTFCIALFKIQDIARLIKDKIKRTGSVIVFSTVTEP